MKESYAKLLQCCLIGIFLLLLHEPPAHGRQASSKQAVDIPDPIIQLFKTKGLDKQYEFAAYRKPLFLRADFNGDGKADTAIWVRQKRTRKVGIAVIHSGTNAVFFLGAGSTIGNGGDNFDWMDYWQVYPKGKVGKGSGETKIVRLQGDALLVGRKESASGLLYWNGKRYLWYQQGD